MSNKKENTEILAIVDLTQEYPGWTGEEQWAVVTNCSGSIIYDHPEVQKHQPCIFMTSEQWEAIVVSLKNDEKFRTRDRRKHDLFGYEDCDIERDSSSTNPVLDEIVLREIKKCLVSASNIISDKQRQRLKMYLIDRYSLAEIASLEKVSTMSIHESIKAGIKIIKNYFS